MSVTLTVGTTNVVVSDVVAAPLRRPLRRADYEVLDSSDYQIVAGTPGRLRGSITYLCATLADALAADALYQGAAAVTLTDAGNPLNGLKHIAVGEIQYGTERTVPGVPCRWTLTVEIREVA